MAEEIAGPALLLLAAVGLWQLSWWAAVVASPWLRRGVYRLARRWMRSKPVLIVLACPWCDARLAPRLVPGATALVDRAANCPRCGGPIAPARGDDGSGAPRAVHRVEVGG